MKFAILAVLISATSAANCIYPKEKITKPLKYLLQLEFQFRKFSSNSCIFWKIFSANHTKRPIDPGR